MFIDKTHYPNRKSVYSSSTTRRDNHFRPAEKYGGAFGAPTSIIPPFCIIPDQRIFSTVPRVCRVVPSCAFRSTPYNHSHARVRRARQRRHSSACTLRGPPVGFCYPWRNCNYSALLEHFRSDVDRPGSTVLCGQSSLLFGSDAAASGRFPFHRSRNSSRRDSAPFRCLHSRRRRPGVRPVEMQPLEASHARGTWRLSGLVLETHRDDVQADQRFPPEYRWVSPQPTP